jgi:hypothetical protein
MRLSKPAIGYRNMRKVTSSEGKLLGLDRKIVLKIMIMSDETGKIIFWFRKHRFNELTQFTGSIDEYFDVNLANIKLEQYWSKYSLS